MKNYKNRILERFLLRVGVCVLGYFYLATLMPPPPYSWLPMVGLIVSCAAILLIARRQTHLSKEKN